MYTFITSLIIIIGLLLILVVLVQRPKGGGLSSNFTSSNQIMGVQRTADFIEKLTWGLTIALFTLCIVVNFFIPRGSGSSNESSLKDRIENLNVPAVPKSGGASTTKPGAGTTAPAQQPAQEAAPAKK